MPNFVQSAIDSGDPAEPTLAAGATAGNLLVCWAMERSGATSVTTPSGWTKAIDRYVAPSDTTYRRAGAFFYKVADGGETSVSIDFSSTNTIKAILAEFELDGANGEDQWDLLTPIMDDNGSVTGGTGGVKSIATGDTDNFSFTRALMLGFVGIKSSTAVAPDTFAFTGDLANDIESFEENGRSLALSYGLTTTDGVQNETASWENGDGDLGRLVGLVVFDLVSGGGGGGLPIPVAMHNYRMRRVA